MPLDLTKLPSDPFEAQAALLLSDLDERVRWALRYVTSEYHDRQRLQECREFVSYHLAEAGPSHLEAFARIGFFPWTEAEHELDQAIYHSLLGTYKAGFDHLRRALELVAVGCFFTSSLTSTEDARAWLLSQRDTPLFTRALDRLGNLPRFQRLDDQTQWIEKLKFFYWNLCDIIHVRGADYGFQVIQPISGHLSGVSVSRTDPKALTRLLDAFVESTRHIALLLAVSYPILLFGLPMESKFGISGPMGGFYEEHQASLLRSLLPDHARDPLIALAEADHEVRALREDILARPDITDAELRQQIDDFDRLMKRGDA